MEKFTHLSDQIAEILEMNKNYSSKWNAAIEVMNDKSADIEAKLRAKTVILQISITCMDKDLLKKECSLSSADSNLAKAIKNLSASDDLQSIYINLISYFMEIKRAYKKYGISKMDVSMSDILIKEVKEANSNLTSLDVPTMKSSDYMPRHLKSDYYVAKHFREDMNCCSDPVNYEPKHMK